MIRIFVAGIPVESRNNLAILVDEIRTALVSMSADLEMGSKDQVPVKFLRNPAKQREITIFLISEKNEKIPKDVKEGLEQAVGKYFLGIVPVKCVLSPNASEIMDA